MSEESHIVSIQTASGQEIVGMVWGDIERPFLTVKDAVLIIERTKISLASISSRKHDNFLTPDIIVNTAGAYIVELHPDSKLFDAWKHSNSNILMPQKKPVQIAKGGGRLN